MGLYIRNLKLENEDEKVYVFMDGSCIHLIPKEDILIIPDEEEKDGKEHN